MEVFFDTEFTTLGDRINLPHLISIGCVAQGGEEFYAELTDTWQQSACSEFVVENVLPLLQGGDSRMKESELAIRLKDWIERLTTNEEVVFCTDSPSFDWPFVGELFNFYGWPKNMRRKYGTVFFEEEWRNQYYDAGVQEFWSKNLARQHHSLVDARSMQCAWKFAMQQSQPLTTCEDRAIIVVSLNKTPGRVEQGFIQDECAAQKEKNRRQFGDLIKQGLAKASDASMFRGLAYDSKVTYRNEDFDIDLDRGKTLLFLDCEFTDFIQCDLISIALLSEDGQHSFYAERSDFEQGWCNQEVKAGILPLLDGSNRVTRAELAQQLFAWLNSLPTDVEIGCDSRMDWDLFMDALDGDLPHNVAGQPRSLRHLTDNPVFNEAVRLFHSLPNKPWHHALADVQAHRAGWLAWRADKK